MENLLPFVYGILTCIGIAGIIYGVIKVREIENDTDITMADLDDLQSKHNILEREFEAKLDTLSNAIVGVDEKLDRIYNQASEEIQGRFEDLEDDINQLQIKQ